MLCRPVGSEPSELRLVFDLSSSRLANSRANIPTPEEPPRKKVKCSVCGQEGHNKKRHEMGNNNNGETAAAAIHHGPAPPPIQPNPEMGILWTPELDEDGNFLTQEDEEMLESIMEQMGMGDDQFDEADDAAEVVPTGQYQWSGEPVESLPSIKLRGNKVVPASIFPEGFQGKQGTKGIPTGTRSPGQFLDLLFTPEILQKFVDETNSYARKQSSYGWTQKLLTITELKTFFAIVLYMGIQKQPSRDMYWEKSIFESKFVRSLMTKRRFLAIAANLHWRDVSDISKEEKEKRNKADGFWSIDDFLACLAENFQLYYTCGRLLNIDEMCIFFKGRHRCKCYNPSKPNKWHLKAFCLNDSESGYLFNFFMYRGCDEQRPAGMPATVWPVHKLTEIPTLYGKGHILATDNWYTSLLTVEELTKEPKLFHCIGTCRINKKGLPPAGIFPTKGKNVRKQGELAMHKVADREIYFISWMDNKPVHLLTTWPSFSTTVTRIEKMKKGGYERKIIPIPTCIKAYNQSMGGTDKFDQFGSYYDDRQRTLNWKNRIFFHFFRAACINACILFRLHTVKKKVQLKDFITSVILDWAQAGKSTLDEADSDSEDEGPQRPDENSHKNQWERCYEFRRTGQHFPEKASTSCKRDSRGKLVDRREHCKLCRANSSFRCSTCGVFLCITDNYQTSCFYRFHTEKNFAD